MTGLLLDSHVALWLLADEPVEPAALVAVADPENEVFVSVVSPWELAIKQGLGRLELREDYLAALLGQGVRLLGVELAHTQAVRRLPQHHRDPFDRMLVAQAQVERLTLVTRDRRLAQYDVPVIDA